MRRCLARAARAALARSFVAVALVAASARNAKASAPETAAPPSIAPATAPATLPGPATPDAPSIGPARPTVDPRAADKPVVVWPTLTPAGDDAGQIPLHKPALIEGTLSARAQELDATLRDAVQDLGFTLDIADLGPVTPTRTRDLDIIERAGKSSARGGPQDPGTWVVSARLEPTGGDSFLLRIVTVPPKGKQLRVRVERVSGPDVSLRGLVLLRDLLTTTRGGVGESGPRPEESASTGVMSTLHSQGRAVLAVNAALFGAFIAYSVQRASGSEDPRLLYPLVTLGTGIGLGGALLVAEEWDVGTGDAWTLASAAWWGTASGVAIANGRRVQPLTDRYAYGVGGGLIGLSLATLSLTRGKADEGDAVLVNSGAALGLGFGAFADFFYAGDIERHTPYIGAGVGTAVGLVAGGTLATFVEVSPSRVLLIDLGAGLGAAAGAAVGSPLVFEDVTAAKTRGFVAATAGGMLLGGSVAWWLARERLTPPKTSATPHQAVSARHVLPFGGVVGSSATPEGSVPAYGAGLRGTW